MRLVVLLARVVILTRLRCLLAEWIVCLLLLRSGFGLDTSLWIAPELVVGLVALRALVLHCLCSNRCWWGLLGQGQLLRWGR